MEQKQALLIVIGVTIGQLEIEYGELKIEHREFSRLPSRFNTQHSVAIAKQPLEPGGQKTAMLCFRSCDPAPEAVCLTKGSTDHENTPGHYSVASILSGWVNLVGSADAIGIQPAAALVCHAAEASCICDPGA